MKPITKAVLGLSFALIVGATSACNRLAMNQNGHIAMVNGQPVSLADYNRTLDQAKKEYEQHFHVDFNSDQGKKMLSGMKDSIVHQLINQKLLMLEAQKRGLKASDAEIELKLATIKKSFPNDDAFNKVISQYGLTLPELKQQIAKEIVVEKLQNDVTKDIQVTDAQVAAFYHKNLQMFTHGAEVHARHILVKFDPNAKDKAKDEARALAKIQEIQAKLKAGAKFSQLAEQYSDDPGSKAQGGDLGFFARGQMVPQFEKAAFSLKDGQISGPVKTIYGYHLIKRIAGKQAGVEPLSEVAPGIRMQLENQVRNQAFQAFVAKLNSSAKIVIDPAYQPQVEPAAPDASASTKQ